MLSLERRKNAIAYFKREARLIEYFNFNILEIASSKQSTASTFYDREYIVLFLDDMTKTLATTLTLEEFLKLPETKPASEYINNQKICKPMPQGKHSTIQSELVAAINSSLKSDKIARAFTELRCTFDDRSIVPDISVFQWEKIPRDENGKIANRFELAPDWVIEILSPQQNQTRVVKNIIHCLKNGTKMGWLIDPEEETVFVYEPKQEIAVFDHNDTIISVPNFADSFQLNLDDLFGWLL